MGKLCCRFAIGKKKRCNRECKELKALADAEGEDAAYEECERRFQQNVQSAASGLGPRQGQPHSPAVDLVVTAKGFETFPAWVLDACVNVDSWSSIGSGVCVGSGGLILTAGHVASLGDVRRVTFRDGRAADATCLKTCDIYDLSLLKMPTGEYPAARLADGPAPVKSKVACVGQPGVRAKQRLEVSVGKIVLQTKEPLAPQLESGGLVHNCPIYSGSSGSPLFHFQTGSIVGIHTGFDHNKFQAEAVTVEAIKEFVSSAHATGTARVKQGKRKRDRA